MRTLITVALAVTALAAFRPASAQDVDSAPVVSDNQDANGIRHVVQLQVGIGRVDGTDSSPEEVKVLQGKLDGLRFACDKLQPNANLECYSDMVTKAWSEGLFGPGMYVTSVLVTEPPASDTADKGVVTMSGH